MKLRFRQNSLRLRLNRLEVERLASGAELWEEVHFPGNGRMIYGLRAGSENIPAASFRDGTISVVAPITLIDRWAAGEEVGMYFDLPAEGSRLAIAIEKDLECLDGPIEERDPDAFPRAAESVC
jgi:hypothetical protein